MNTSFSAPNQGRRWAPFLAGIRGPLVCVLFGCLLALQVIAAATPQPLILKTILASVTDRYPPYLAALIERDLAGGRYQSALGAMDLQTYFRLFNNPTGFYDSTTVEAGFEQFTNLRGATLFGGYKYTDGTLPDYYSSRRTNEGGTPTLGLRLPLLRNGAIDYRRAAIYKANIEQELADPIIRKQHLDISLAAMRAYFNWVASGRKLAITESLLNLARERAQAIDTQIAQGLIAPIASLENRQLVVSREISTVKAKRKLEAASAALSLFFRNEEDKPIIPNRNQLPPGFPAPQAPPPNALSLTLQHASAARPEVTIYELKLEKLAIDTRLFRNQLQPYLNAYIKGSQSLGDTLYKDKDEFELELGLEFKMPLQRNQAKGNLRVNKAQIEQLELDTRMALDRIAAEVWNAHSAVQAAWEQIGQAELNVSLAGQLHEVERDRFALGAVDFLTLQLREQTDFRARLSQVEVIQQYFTALADLIVAAGLDARTIHTSENSEFTQILQSLTP